MFRRVKKSPVIRTTRTSEFVANVVGMYGEDYRAWRLVNVDHV